MKRSSTPDVSPKLILQTVHLDLTDAMENVMREKLAVLLRHSEYIVRLSVRLHRDQTMGNEHHYTATGQIEISGPDLVASAEGKDAYEVIDTLVDKLDGQLARRHGKRKDRRNHPRASEIDVDLPKAK